MLTWSIVSARAYPRSVRPARHAHVVVHVAVLVCSAPECAERSQELGTLAELETLVCECGCGLLVVGWPAQVEEDVRELVPA